MENVALVNFDQFKQFAREVFSEEIKILLTTQNLISNKETEKLFSRTELAEYLGLSTATITTYKNDGMPFLRVKRRPYFKLKDVEQYMTKKNKK